MWYHSKGLPRGEFDCFFRSRRRLLCVSVSARLPLGESKDLPRGGKTPLAGGILVSLVGEGLPLGGQDVPPRRGEDSPWV